MTMELLSSDTMSPVALPSWSTPARAPAPPPSKSLVELTQWAIEALQEHIAPVVLQPWVPQVEEETLAWVRRLGLANSRMRKKLERIKCATFASLIYPQADREATALFAKFYAWLWVFDDSYGEGRAKDGKSLEEMAASLNQTLLRGTLPTDAGAHHLAMRDLHEHFAARGGATWLGRMAEDFCGYVEGCAGELASRAAGFILPRKEFSRLRLLNSGSYGAFDLVELDMEETLSPARFAKPEIQALRQQAALVCAFDNDLVSFAMESKEDDASFNLVTVLQQEQGLSLEEAFEEAFLVTQDHLERFSTLRERFDRLPSTSSLERRYTQGLWDCINGHRSWVSLTLRYQVKGA